MQVRSALLKGNPARRCCFHADAPPGGRLIEFIDVRTDLAYFLAYWLRLENAASRSRAFD
ncbi:hypothetical protein ABZT45_31485 [Streptomyces sp. NPDC005356]|uniref:hypothetical protein n=1 Tax=Streptomyces sp. NPDC005356 TaxID=3157167 RepID=UPI0033B5F01E